MKITITPEERWREQMTDAHLAQAIGAVRTDGYVVIANVTQAWAVSGRSLGVLAA